MQRSRVELNEKKHYSMGSGPVIAEFLMDLDNKVCSVNLSHPVIFQKMGEKNFGGTKFIQKASKIPKKGGGYFCV